jgi:alginate O-acetyltransferase complex protein AlgI
MPFYSWAAPKFVFLMLATTVVDWLLSIVIAGNRWNVWRTFRSPLETLVKGEPRSRTQYAAVTISIVSNLMMLGFFKYFNFAMDSYGSLAEMLGLSRPQWHTGVKHWPAAGH